MQMIRGFLTGSFLTGTLWAQAVTPSVQGDQYTFEVGPVSLGATTQSGGRINSLTLDGEEVLYLNSNNGNINWGSTFWPSPQNWGWPPPRVLDEEAYTAAVSDTDLVLTSGLDGATGLVVRKKIVGRLDDTSLTVTYTMVNGGSNTIQYAPWEITRVPSGGLTFYPQGQGSPSGALASLTVTQESVTWFDYDSSSIPGGVPKLLSDGSNGWLAHVTGSRVLLLKSFEDVPANEQAPNEAEIELYTNPDLSYQEVEQQGVYGSMAPGDSVSWEVKWYLRQLPPALTASVGNADLVTYAENLAQQTSPLSKHRVLGDWRISRTASEFLLHFPQSQYGSLEIVLRRPSGKIVWRKEVFLEGEQKLLLPVPSLVNGIYVLEMRTNGQNRNALLTALP